MIAFTEALRASRAKNLAGIAVIKHDLHLVLWFLLALTPTYAQVKSSNLSPSSVTLSWPQNLDGENTIRFSIAGLNEWTIHHTGADTFIRISGLRPNTTYEVQMKAGKAVEAELWSPVQTIRTLCRPNVVVILADDGRYDTYNVNNGPTWFQTPNINKIATEGANFKYCFPALSLCSPSRASIVTGLYPHHHGVVNNEVSDSLTIPTIATILHDSGYYVGWIGKYGFNKFPQPGYDYFIESATAEYTNTYYNYNGETVFLPDHKTNVFTEKALEFLDQVPPDKPFCMFLAHKAPHVPLEPRPEDAGLYTNEMMPFPENFYHYDIDFPSYLYDCHLFSDDSAELKSAWLSYLQLVAGIDWSVGEVADKLEAMGIMDSTLIIYTSDNGLLKGEHLLQGKQLALDESLKLPMFIRYPAWFNPNEGIRIDDEMAMNIDIAPTILDAAGITNPVTMDGWSMHDLATGVKKRKEFLYEYYNKEECTPTMHAVRSFDYTYISNSCDHNADEFYDLINDSLQNHNLIDEAGFGNLIQSYKHKLDSLRYYYGDTIWVDTIVSCKLYTIPSGTFQPPQLNDLATIFPNPGNEWLHFSWNLNPVDEVEISITDITGRQFIRRIYSNVTPGSEEVYLGDTQPGIYLITFKSGNQRQLIKYVQQE
jgi:N-acetylglucosamine-6-sulfatase